MHMLAVNAHEGGSPPHIPHGAFIALNRARYFLRRFPFLNLGLLICKTPLRFYFLPLRLDLYSMSRK